MLSNKKHGFTLVELLAVIVILAVILVIAVPKLMDIINDTKKSTFANSVKLIASGAEQRYAENKVLGKNEEINCENVAKLSTDDYKLCEIAFEKEEARVTVIGDGKFEGLSVVYATKTNAEVQTGEPERLYTFDEVYELVDNLTARIEELENNSNGNDKIDELENKVNNNTSRLDKNESDILNLTNKEDTNNVFLQTYPVGSIYISENNTNPGTKFGGTWVAYGAGRTLVGVDSTQTEFATVGFTGGEKEHTLTIDEMPNHSHDEYYTWSGASSIGGNWKTQMTSTSNGGVGNWPHYSGLDYVADTGGSQPHNNLQPYITVYMWKRTA